MRGVFISLYMRRMHRAGRFAFARGNTAWARNFNIHLSQARGMASIPIPAAWRVLGSAPILSLCAESPITCGFAEQFQNSITLMCSELTSNEDASDLEEFPDASLVVNEQLSTGIIGFVNMMTTWSLAKET